MSSAMDPDELYGLALDRFIPERGALAKALRADKRRDEAAAVAALRKPSVAAWAVNQLVRSQPGAVQELFDAGDALRDAQARLLDGSGDGRALRAANERERAAVDELVDAAHGLLSSEGHELSAAVVERVAGTLHAAALSEDAREQVREGQLERELRHIGLGLGEEADPFAVAPPAPSRPRAKPAKEKASRGRPPTPPARNAAAQARDAVRRGAPGRARAGQARPRGARAPRARAGAGAQGGAHRRGGGEAPRRTRRARPEGRRRAPRARGEGAGRRRRGARGRAGRGPRALRAQKEAQAQLDAL